MIRVATSSDDARACVHVGRFVDVAEARRAVAELADAKNVELLINSHGGDADAAELLHDALAGRTRVAHVIGTAASAGYFLALAADRVRIVNSGRIMIHRPTASVAAADLDELRAVVAKVERSIATWTDRIAKRASVDPATIRAWLSGEDRWFTAEEALDCRLVDEVYEARRPDRPTPDDFPESDGAETSADPQPDGAELFEQVLRAFDVIRVRDKGKFFASMNRWFATKVVPEDE